jgi:hypothetical protein
MAAAVHPLRADAAAQAVLPLRLRPASLRPQQIRQRVSESGGVPSHHPFLACRGARQSPQNVKSRKVPRQYDLPKLSGHASSGFRLTRPSWVEAQIRRADRSSDDAHDVYLRRLRCPGSGSHGARLTSKSPVWKQHRGFARPPEQQSRSRCCFQYCGGLAARCFRRHSA